MRGIEGFTLGSFKGIASEDLKRLYLSLVLIFDSDNLRQLIAQLYENGVHLLRYLT